MVAGRETISALHSSLIGGWQEHNKRGKIIFVEKIFEQDSQSWPLTDGQNNQYIMMSTWPLLHKNEVIKIKCVEYVASKMEPIFWGAYLGIYKSG